MEQVQQRGLALYGRGRLGQYGIRVVASGRNLVIPYLIEARDELVQEMVERAGLQLTKQGCGYRTYTAVAAE